MFNIGGGEAIVIFLVALIVLGPAKLPEVARQAGAAMRELRRLSSGFTDEMRSAMDEPVEAAGRERGQRVVATQQGPAPDERLDETDGTDRTDSDAIDDVVDDHIDGNRESTLGEPQISTAEAAGMYDIAADDDE